MLDVSAGIPASARTHNATQYFECRIPPGCDSRISIRPQTATASGASGPTAFTREGFEEITKAPTRIRKAFRCHVDANSRQLPWRQVVSKTAQTNEEDPTDYLQLKGASYHSSEPTWWSRSNMELGLDHAPNGSRRRVPGCPRSTG